MNRWVVEMTIDGSVRPVVVRAESREAAKDAAEVQEPRATRIYGAYTAREWAAIERKDESS